MSLPELDLPILWLDVETTGFDPASGHLLEVGARLTTWDLVTLSEKSYLVRFDGPVDDVIADMHGPHKSGLLAACATSHAALFPHEVEEMLMAWLRRHDLGRPGRRPVLAGNSVHFDRAWLAHHLPRLLPWVSHRHLDVTTLDLVFSAWAGTNERAKSAAPHRALPDLDRSLTAARGYFARLHGLQRTEADLAATLQERDQLWHVVRDAVRLLHEGQEGVTICGACEPARLATRRVVLGFPGTTRRHTHVICEVCSPERACSSEGAEVREVVDLPSAAVVRALLAALPPKEGA